jgi:hypothetical protein
VLAEIKKALNSRLGTPRTIPLDMCMDINAYLAFFMFADYLNSKTSATAYNLMVVPKKIIEPSDVDPYYTKDIIIPPWVEEIADDAKIPVENILLPPSLKKIGNNAFYGWDLSSLSSFSISIPYSVEQIASNAFGSIGFVRVIINKKQNEIEGFPWGHPRPEYITYMYE